MLTPAEVPRLPIFGWQVFEGLRATDQPSLLDAPHIRYTTSGRAAIALALQALKIPSGSQVLVPTYHCPTMVSPVEAHGCKPLFYPIDANGTLLMEWLERLDTRNVSALLLPHYFGLPQSIAHIRVFCDAYRIALIEDCAHALFGEADQRAIGSWGDVAIASLTKFLPVPEGGLLVSHRRNLNFLSLTPRGHVAELKTVLDILEVGAQYGRLTGLNHLLRALFWFKRRLRGSPDTPASTDHSETSGAQSYGFDPRLIHAQATVMSKWLAQHAHRERITYLRQKNFARLSELFSDCEQIGLRPLIAKVPDRSAPYVFPLWVDQPESCYPELRASGLGLFRWNWLWPNTPQIEGDQGRRWSRHIFQLPCHQDLDETALQCIAHTVRTICAQHYRR